MQINISLDKDNIQQAATLRSAWFQNCTVRQVKDAFIFDQSISRFDAEPSDLLPFFHSGEIVQRMITIKAETYQRLKEIAAVLEKPMAATLRAIIAYTIAQLSDNPPKTNTQISPSTLAVLREKLLLLEQQAEACNNTIAAIKSLITEEEAENDITNTF